MPAISVRGLRKAYGAHTVLDLDSFEVGEGEFFVLLGPSGSGKTTLLRILAGLLSPDAGSVELYGRDVAGEPPHRRGIGYVFQGLALWPHMTARGNIALGLDLVLPDARERAHRIEETAQALGVEQLLDRRPARLSGGERQRVALARTLARRPGILLLDEPFSDLDARTRRSAARLVRRLHGEHGMATLLITHDRTDAHLLADRMGLLREGRLVACGTPDELHRAMPGRFAAEFLTDAALVRGRVGEDGRLATPLGPLALEEPSPAGSPLLVAIRPEEIALDGGGVPGRVLGCEFAGGRWRCRIAVGDAEVFAHNDARLAPGEAVGVRPPRTPRRALEEDA
ncbi:MAG: ABC transporter ATP-binding protein [Planctomycetaceae bacterium]